MDSDEEEMAALRNSSRYGGGVRKPTLVDTSADDGDVAEESDLVESRRCMGGPRTNERAESPEIESSMATAEPEDDDEMMRNFLPVSFGKKKAEKNTGVDVHKNTARGSGTDGSGEKKASIQFGRRMRDPVSILGANKRADRLEEETRAKSVTQREELPSPADVENALESDRGQAFTDEDGEDDGTLPVSHEVGIPAHDKAVTALDFDPKASRMMVGSMDGICRFYDFGGMSEEKRFFRELEPVENHMVQAISYNKSGGCILVASSDSHARIYDRDGCSKPIQSTVKGDMYVRDMQHTKGHTQMLTSGVWHPFNVENFITSSLDGTVRIWDMNATPVGLDQVLPSVHVLKTLDRRGVCVGGASGRQGGLHPSSCAYASDAKMIVGGCSDGSVQVFFEKQRYMRPDKILRSAHTAAVTSAYFVSRGSSSTMLLTRSMDHSMKVWDTRMMSDAKGPVKTFDELPCGSEKSGVCCSPDGRFIVAGTSAQKHTGSAAAVRIYDVSDFSLARALDFGDKNPTTLSWPKELNQIVVGTSRGEVTMLYSPLTSRKGAMHFVGRKAKVKALHETGASVSGPIFNMTDPTDIQKFWSTGHGDMTKIRRQEARANQKTLTPIRPMDRNTSKAATTDQSAFAAMVVAAGAKQLRFQNASGQETDSQKALLAYAGKAKDSGLVDDAYKSTQPTKLLDWSVDESEGDKRMQASLKGDFCRKCGQKVCRCVDYSVWGQKRQRTG